MEEVGNVPSGFTDGINNVGGISYGNCTYYRSSSVSWCFDNGDATATNCLTGHVVSGVTIDEISNSDNENFCLRINCYELLSE